MFTHSLSLLANISTHCSLYSPLLNPEDWEQIFPPLAMVLFGLFVSVASSTPPTSATSQKKKTFLQHKLTLAAPNKTSLWLRVNSNPPEVHKTISPLQSALRDTWQQKRLLFPQMAWNHLWMLCVALFYAEMIASKSICKWKLLEGVPRLVWNHFATFPKRWRRKANAATSNSRR